MIVTILLWCIAFIVSAVLLILLSPFRVRLCGAFDGASFNGSALCSFVHPKVLRAEVSFAMRSVEVRVFGWRPVRRRGRKNGGQSDTSEGYEPVFDAGVSAPPSPPSEKPAAEVARLPLSPVNNTLYSEEMSSREQPVLEDIQQTQPEVIYPEEKKVEMRSDGRKSYSKEPATTSSAPFGTTGESPQNRTSSPEPDESMLKEKVAPAKEKKDNWLYTLKRHIAVHFIMNSSWRTRVFRWVLRFLRSLLFLIRFDQLRCEVRAGVEDPMITGTLAGYFYSIGAVLTKKDRYLFSFEPVFMKNFLSGSLQLRVTTSLFMLSFPMVAAVITFPWVRTLLLWLSYRRMKRRYQALAAA